VSGAHSLLAPSAAEIWARCAGALHLSRGLPDVDKEYNASGTCSHWLAKWAFDNPTLSLDSWLGKELEFGDSEKFKFIIDEDRIERVRIYVTSVHREPGQLWTEKRLNSTPVLGLPNQEGHADAVKLDMLGAVEIDGKQYRGVLSAHDFKDGYLLVKAKNNLQGLMYLASGLYEFDLMTEINALRFVVCQPKINNYDEWTYTRAEIEHFVTVIRPAAKLAYDIYYGSVDFDPAQHLNAGEEQCLWCPVRGSCPARAKRIVDMFAPLINRHALDDATLGAIYIKLDEIESAVRDFRAEAYRRALAGTVLPEHKLVYGNRGRRKWIDKVKAESNLSLVLPEERLYEPREIISPTAAEKLLKKAAYEPLKQLVTQDPPALTLVHVTDKRDAVEPLKFGTVPPQESLT
jgi:hypothetical protein